MIPPDKLPYAARRVLNCINQMFAVYFWKTAIQPRLLKHDDLDTPYLALENSTVESSLLAIRAFDDFVRNTRNRADDLLASDFPGYSPISSGIDPAERTKINKQIMHLTHLDLEAAVQGYSYRDTLARLVPVAIAFCDHVITRVRDEDRLHEFAADTKIVCDTVRSQYINR